MTPDGDHAHLVMCHVVAEGAGLSGAPGIRALPPLGRRQRRVDPEVVLDAIDAAGPHALVLARPPWAEPGMAPLPAMAVVTGRPLLWLPADAPAASWAAALVAAWARTTPPDDLFRRAQVAVGLATMSPRYLPPHLPARAWGQDGAVMPAVSPDALARWCDCAWTPCGWCDARRAARAPCPVCGDAGAAA